MNTQKMYDLKDMLCRELDSIAGKGELSAGDLEAAHKLTSTIKNLDKVLMYEEGYSQGGDWSGEMRGSYGNSYRGRSRDAMGRYSGDGGSYNGRSYRGGYSRGSALEHLEQAMNEAGSEREREAIRKAMDSLR